VCRFVTARLPVSRTTPICKDIFTSIAWLARWVHEQFLQKWQIASDTSSISWKCPNEWKGWTSHYAKAIFSAFAGRTATDPRFNKDSTPCKCGHPDLSSRPIIEQCPIFDQRRQKIWNGHEAPPNLTSDMLLDKEWGSKVRVCQENWTRFSLELIWNSERTGQEFMEEAEEFETGIFE
jgi:hypothetical protein